MQEMVLIIPYTISIIGIKNIKNTRVCYRKQMQEQIGQREVWLGTV
jgi:hypothetical protein